MKKEKIRDESGPSGDLLRAEQLAAKLDPSGRAITGRTLKRLHRERKIPACRTGYRSLWFDEAAVRVALAKFTVREVQP